MVGHFLPHSFCELNDLGCMPRVTKIKNIICIMIKKLRGCLHDTGATFAPERGHSGSLSWLYICLHDTTTKCYAGASHPGVSVWVD